LEKPKEFRARVWTFLPACLLLLAFATLYTATLSDGSDLGKSHDSQTLLHAAKTIAPPYTTGYPLYMLLTVPGLRLPAPGGESSTAFYASALPAALALVFLYFAALRASGSAVAAFLAAILFGLFHGTWLFGTSVYTYGLALALQWTLYVAALRYLDAPTPRNALLVVVAFGLGCANHPLNVLLALPLSLLCFARRDRHLPQRFWLAAAAILTACAALYLYLPITSPHAPWRGDLRSVRGLVHYLTGEGRGGNFAWSGIPAGLAILWHALTRWTLVFWLPLAAFGLVAHARREPWGAAFVAGSWTVLLLFIAGYYGEGHGWLYLPFLWGAPCLWIASAAGFAGTWLARRQPRWRLAPAAALALLVLWQAGAYATLDVHVRTLRAHSPVVQAVERAMVEGRDAPSPKRLVTIEALWPLVQVRVNGEGLYGSEGPIRGDWQLRLWHAGEPLPATARTVLWLGRGGIPGETPARDYLRAATTFAVGAGWTRTWIEYGHPGETDPLRILGVRVDRCGPRRVRVWMLLYNAGFQKLPEEVHVDVRSAVGERLGESDAPLNHLGRPLARLRHGEEYVDERAIDLARDANTVQIEPILKRGTWGELPATRVQLVRRRVSDSS